MVSQFFFQFSFWDDIERYISHVAIYPSINKMKNIGEINILLISLFLNLDPLTQTL